MASHLPRALPTGQGPSPSDHIASTTSTAAAKNASTAMVVSMTSPVNSPNLPNTVSNADIANLRNISNIATWPYRGKGHTVTPRRRRRKGTRWMISVAATGRIACELAPARQSIRVE
jgi:hypothetical protein